MKHRQRYTFCYAQEELNYECRSVVELSRCRVCTSDLGSDKRCTRGCHGYTWEQANHQEGQEGDGSILLHNAKPSSGECHELPLPRVDPEHYQLWYAI